MSGPVREPEDAQAQASDPERSAWVSANAGSGKTTVLVRRVIRLLLRGVAPGRILCLTYTKAAAAHMANEVLKQLRAWVRLDDEALDKALAAIDPRKPDPARRAMMRRLFAAALETPGGLKVQTIHAFCDRVLHMFPVEADAPAGFEVLDELGERDLIERARLDVLLDAGNSPESAIGRAFRHCIEICGDDAIEQTLSEAVRERHKFSAISADAAAGAISSVLGLKTHEGAEAVGRSIVDQSALPRAEWHSIGASLSALGGKNAQATGELFFAAANADETGCVDAYLDVFLTKGERTLKKPSTLGGEKDLDEVPSIRDGLYAELDRLGPLLDKLRAARECERSMALLILANAVIERYESAKRTRGVLDFADLVTKTVDLLEREASAWVHYKLDGGIDHILVDEAQDTSPEQWRIVGKLAEEFFAGKGASDEPRTIFAVGDEKQSIFSFQGADPKRFDEMRRSFERAIAATGSALLDPKLEKSYRSSPTVLRAVDTIFSHDRAWRGLSANDDVRTLHQAARASAPGVVELWPLTVSRRGRDDEAPGWEAPVDTVHDAAAPAVLANQIAKAVHFWINGGLSVGDKRSFRSGKETRLPARAKDIIILVQRRGTLFDAILRALKRADVPVAGADRLILTEHIAIMDLLALGDALLLERDDLQLAAVLKSPLFGFDDGDLLALAYDRQGSLWQSLMSKAAGKPLFAEAERMLSLWREEASHLRPFDLYSRVLGRDGGRRRLIARLGLEAADAIDEFLSRALAYESIETPSLQGFLGFLRRAGAEVKRDLESESGAVRVMTTHGVKGLEAPIVVLADTTAKPFANKDPKIVFIPVPDQPPETPPAFLWALGRKEESACLSDAREAARELREAEYRRLLYVALTRAADMLVVCGMLNDNQKAAEAGSWYELVSSAIDHESERDHVTKHRVPYRDEEISRWHASEIPLSESKAPAKVKEPNLPAWLNTRYESPGARRDRLRPSRARDGVALAEARPGGRQRGVLVHRLLQSLPNLAADARRDAAMRYLSQAAPRMTPLEHAALVSEALRVIEERTCAVLFGPGSRAEAELAARIDGPDGDAIEVSARLDRILIGAGAVTFADFKSDAMVPATPADIPAHYLAQLAAYRAALAAAFPGRELRGMLIFTAGPKVFEIPEESLESAWRQLAAQSSAAFA